MINITRLLKTRETALEVREHLGKEGREVPKHLIRYSSVASPMVVWNITRRCNLSCPVCHLGSAPEADPGELSTREAGDLIDQMAEMGVPLVSVYGGEPLTRDDFLELAGYAAERGLRMIFSSNATLITRSKAERIREAGIPYVGIDLDGLAQQGGGGMDVVSALKRAMPAVEHLRGAGVGCGVRVTVGNFNIHELPGIVEAIEKAGIRRVAVCQFLQGRGSWREIREERRAIMDFLIDYAVANPQMEVVTEHFYADGAYILERLRERDPSRAEAVGELLRVQGGCPAGRKLVNIGPSGDVHPCIYWRTASLGNIRQQNLNELWEVGSPLLKELRNREEHLRGKCGRCPYAAGCGGCRDRAEEVFGDCMQQDPGCYVSAKTI